MKYAFIQEHQWEFNIRLMCQLLKVNRSSYYDWQKSSFSLCQHQNSQQLGEKIKGIFTISRGTYGTRRIKCELKKQGCLTSRRRIGRLMKQQQLICKGKRRFKATTDSKHGLSIAPHLLGRQFKWNKANQIYVGDITYIATAEGWVYLAVVIDLFSRKIVGWAMSRSMKTELVNDALFMALNQRRPARGLLWHTDRGCQYAAQEHRALLKEHGIIQSMSRQGNCWDNAVSESFFRTLKVELIYTTQFKNREEARQAIFEYIEIFYNRIRIHSANDYLSPAEYERQHLAA